MNLLTNFLFAIAYFIWFMFAALIAFLIATPILAFIAVAMVNFAQHIKESHAR